MDKKIIATLLIALLAIVTAVSLSYYILNQPNQTQNNPSPTPTTTPTPTPTPSPSQIPTEPISIPKPSVPEFTISYVDRSYDVAPTYTTDPYTGETEMLHPAYRAINVSIYVTIKNQAFISHKTADGNFTQLCYFIRAKGHFEQWINDDINKGGNILIYNNSMRIQASSSTNTVVSFPLNYWDVESGGKIDFQVKAVIANRYYTRPDLYFGPYLASDIIEEADWSNTQTITIP